MERSSKDFLAIVGPTASGKTSLSVEVAQRISGEIISMDSRQVYRGLDIGTAKIPFEERRGLPHFGLDLCDPREPFGAGAFARLARNWIRDIRGRDRIPILVGGTGFFLRALTDPIFQEPSVDDDQKRHLRDWLMRQPQELLERWVEAIDSERAAVAAQGGPQRLVRTLEVALLTGYPLSYWHREAPDEGEKLIGLTILVEVPRDELDRRIEVRTKQMLNAGFVAEVEGLLQQGYSEDDPGMSGTGYREVAGYLRSDCGLEEAEDAIVAATRRYARRQLTWFRNQLVEPVFRIDGMRPVDEQARAVISAWNEVEAGPAVPEGTVGRH